MDRIIRKTKTVSNFRDRGNLTQFCYCFYYCLLLPLSHLYHPSITSLSHLYHISITSLSHLYHPSITPLSHLYHISITSLSPLRLSILSLLVFCFFGFCDKINYSIHLRRSIPSGKFVYAVSFPRD